MSPYLRGTLYGAAFVGAFTGGYLLSPKSPAKCVCAPLPVNPTEPDSAVALGPAPLTLPAATVASGDPPPPLDIVLPGPQSPFPPAPVIDFDHLPPPSFNDPVDLSDPTAQLIKNGLGIKTSISDVLGPPPPVVLDAQRDQGPVPGMSPDPLPVPPKFEPAQSPVAIEPMPVKLVNRRDVALDFEITRTGLSKITAVELWSTRDGGRTWSCTDKKSGCQSPFKTRLGSEGEYGFRLVFESASGMRTPEPRPGSPADLCVCLDVTAPKVTLLPVQPIANVPGGVRIVWKMSDAHLDGQCTRLEYSTDGCDWCPIDIADVQAAGDCFSQNWIVPPDVSPEVLLRVSVTDLAGNRTTVQTPGKVSVDLLAPEGKLTGVGVQAAEPETGPMPRVVTEPTAIQSPILGVLQTVVPALLSSPAVGIGMVELKFDDSVPDRGPNPVEAARRWIRQVTDVDIMREPEPVVPKRRQEFRLERRRNQIQVRERIRTAVDRFNLVTGGRTALTVIVDRDWKPSTAKPESYRQWEYTRADSILEFVPFPPAGPVRSF